MTSVPFVLVQNRVRALLAEKSKIEGELEEILARVKQIEDEIAGRDSDDN